MIPAFFFPELEHSEAYVRVAWTLLHFVWQGTLIGALVWGWQLLGPHATSRGRYTVEFSALLLMLMCLPMTYFCLKLGERKGIEAVPVESENDTTEPAFVSLMPLGEELVLSPPADAELPIEADTGLPTTTAGMPSSSRSAQQEVVSKTPWSIRLSAIVTACYFLGVLLMMIRFGVALWGGQRLRNASEPLMDSEILDAISRNAANLRMRAAPTVRTCGRVAVPIVVGILRPVVLLPVSVLTELTPAQLESIIVHEMAHIRRWDHIAIVLQRTIEAILFFHPAVWYVSRSISATREECCDDLVLDAGAKPVIYAEALLKVSRSFANDISQAPALAATGQRVSRVGARIRRVLGVSDQPPVRLTRLGSAVCAAGLLLLMVTVAFTALAVAQAGDDASDETRSEESETPTNPQADDTSTAEEKSAKIIEKLKSNPGQFYLRLQYMPAKGSPIFLPGPSFHLHGNEIVAQPTIQSSQTLLTAVNLPVSNERAEELIDVLSKLPEFAKAENVSEKRFDPPPGPRCILYAGTYDSEEWYLDLGWNARTREVASIIQKSLKGNDARMAHQLVNMLELPQLPSEEAALRRARLRRWLAAFAREKYHTIRERSPKLRVIDENRKPLYALINELGGLWVDRTKRRPIESAKLDRLAFFSAPETFRTQAGEVFHLPGVILIEPRASDERPTDFATFYAINTDGSVATGAIDFGDQLATGGAVYTAKPEPRVYFSSKKFQFEIGPNKRIANWFGREGPIVWEDVSKVAVDDRRSPFGLYEQPMIPDANRPWYRLDHLNLTWLKSLSGPDATDLDDGLGEGAAMPAPKRWELEGDAKLRLVKRESGARPSIEKVIDVAKQHVVVSNAGQYALVADHWEATLRAETKAVIYDAEGEIVCQLTVPKMWIVDAVSDNGRLLIQKRTALDRAPWQERVCDFDGRVLYEDPVEPTHIKFAPDGMPVVWGFTKDTVQDVSPLYTDVARLGLNGRRTASYPKSDLQLFIHEVLVAGDLCVLIEGPRGESFPDRVEFWRTDQKETSTIRVPRGELGVIAPYSKISPNGRYVVLRQGGASFTIIDTKQTKIILQKKVTQTLAGLSPPGNTLGANISDEGTVTLRARCFSSADQRWSPVWARFDVQGKLLNSGEGDHPPVGSRNIEPADNRESRAAAERPVRVAKIIRGTMGHKVVFYEGDALTFYDRDDSTKSVTLQGRHVIPSQNGEFVMTASRYVNQGGEVRIYRIDGEQVGSFRLDRPWMVSAISNDGNLVAQKQVLQGLSPAKARLSDRAGRVLNNFSKDPSFMQFTSASIPVIWGSRESSRRPYVSVLDEQGNVADTFESPDPERPFHAVRASADASVIACIVGDKTSLPTGAVVWYRGQKFNNFPLSEVNFPPHDDGIVQKDVASISRNGRYLALKFQATELMVIDTSLGKVTGRFDVKTKVKPDPGIVAIVGATVNDTGECQIRMADSTLPQPHFFDALFDQSGKLFQFNEQSFLKQQGSPQEVLGAKPMTGNRSFAELFLLSPESERLWPDRADHSDKLQVRARKDDVDALMLLAELEIRSCGGEEAVRLLKRVLELDPKHVRAKLNLAALHLHGGRDSPATELLQSLQQLPANSAETKQARTLRKAILQRKFDREAWFELPVGVYLSARHQLKSGFEGVASYTRFESRNPPDQVLQQLTESIKARDFEWDSAFQLTPKTATGRTSYAVELPQDATGVYSLARKEPQYIQMWVWNVADKTIVEIVKETAL